MRFLLMFYFFIVPAAAIASHGVMSLGVFNLGFMLMLMYGFFIFILLFIPIILLSLLINKSNAVLLLGSITVSIIYALIINFAVSPNDTKEILGLTIFVLIILATILRITLSVRKKLNKDVSSLSRAFLYGIISDILMILLVISYTYGAAFVLNSTECNISLILNSEFNYEKSVCVHARAIEQVDPTFCNKLASQGSRSVGWCEFQVNIAMLKSGDLSTCEYLKPKLDDSWYRSFMGDEAHIILEKCVWVK